MNNEIPKIIKEIGFDFDWSEEKVWKLDLPVEEIPISELTWHFDVPFWDSYTLKPINVANDLKKYKEEYDRTMKSDLSHPLDIMFWKGKWLLLDGLHRLLKAYILKQTLIKVRKVPISLIPKIRKL